MALAFVCEHPIALREVVEFLIVPDSFQRRTVDNLRVAPGVHLWLTGQRCANQIVKFSEGVYAAGQDGIRLCRCQVSSLAVEQDVGSPLDLLEHSRCAVGTKQTVGISQPDPFTPAHSKRMVDHRAFVPNQMAADRYFAHANVWIAPRYRRDVLMRPIRAL